MLIAFASFSKFRDDDRGSCHVAKKVCHLLRSMALSSQKGTLMVEKVEIYTDGACQGNPGPGGWGVLLRYKDTEKELAGFNPATTNNRMELQAAIEGLKSLKR